MTSSYNNSKLECLKFEIRSKTFVHTKGLGQTLVRRPLQLVFYLVQGCAFVFHTSVCIRTLL